MSGNNGNGNKTAVKRISVVVVAKASNNDALSLQQKVTKYLMNEFGLEESQIETHLRTIYIENYIDPKDEKKVRSQ